MELNLILKNNNITDAVQLVKSNLNQCNTNDEKVQRLDSMLASIEVIKTIEIICKLEKEAIIKSLLEVPKQAIEKQSKYGDSKWLAELLGKSLASVYGYTSRGEVPFIKNGNKVLFDKEEVYEWIEEGKIKASCQIKEDALNYLATLRKG